MKSTRLIGFLALILMLTLAVSGCKRKTPGVTKLPPGSGTTGTGDNPSLTSGPGVASGEATASSTGLASNAANAHEGWIPHADILAGDTVYFAFDSSVVRPNEKAKVQAVADYLKNNSEAAVRIEGHCDERGTEEYNRALGDRRALALREQLAGLGIDPSRIDTLSFGKDKAKDPGHNEAAWSKNRRGEFIVLTPPK